MEIKSLFGSIYQKKRVLITGHTGFKGSWLTLWLQRLGAHITGYSLPAETKPSHWECLNLNSSINHFEADLRDYEKLKAVIQGSAPEIVFHLGAQPLVRRSYQNPLETWSTNLLGSVHLLEALRHSPHIKAIVMVTTDKVYENNNKKTYYQESDPLGGHDPYSSSKAACELLISSYRRSFFNHSKAPLLASVRAGNVIGGGDWSEDRLIPDLIRSLSAQKTLTIRSPQAIRPWQHLLDALHGYLCVGEQLLKGNRLFCDSWNFGPESHDHLSVGDLLSVIQKRYPKVQWQKETSQGPHESAKLALNIEKAKKLLDWKPIWSLENALIHTMEWYEGFEKGHILSTTQLEQYMTDMFKYTDEVSTLRK